MIRQILYNSQATVPITSKVLDDILQIAITRNNDLGITGYLMYHNDQFMQVIEGRSEDIETLMNSIKNDKRHEYVTVFIDRMIPEREFPMWLMGFKNLDNYPTLNQNIHIFGLDIFEEEPIKALIFMKEFIAN